MRTSQNQINVYAQSDVDMCLKSASHIPLIALPQSQSSVLTVVLPLTPQQAAATFATTLDLFAINPTGTSPAASGVSTFTSNSSNNNANSQIQCTILAVAVCVGIEVEPQAYCIPAEAVSRTVAGITPVTNGAPGPGDTIRQNATFRHGIDTWLMKIFFARAYSMRVTLGCRFIVLDEALSVTGLCEREQWEGFGTAQTSLIDDFRRANDRLAVNGAPFRIERINSVDAQGGRFPLLPGTVSVQYGAPNLEGSYGGMVRLQQPLLLMNRISFGIQLYVSDDPGAQYFYQRLLAAASSPLVPQFAAAEDGAVLTDIDPALLVGAAPAGGVFVNNYNGGIGIAAVPPGNPVPRDIIEISNVGGVLSGTVLQGISAVASGPIVIPTGTVLTAGATPAAFVALLGPAIAFGPSGVAVGQGGETVVKDGAFVVRFSILGFELAPAQIIEFYQSYSGLWPDDLSDYYLSEGVQAWDKAARMSGLAGVGGFADIKAQVDAAREADKAPRLGRLAQGVCQVASPSGLSLERDRPERRPFLLAPSPNGRMAGPWGPGAVRPFFAGSCPMVIDLFEYAAQVACRNPRLATGILLGQYIPVTYRMQVVFTDPASTAPLGTTLSENLNCDLLVYDLSYSVVRPNYFTGSLFRAQEEVNNTLVPGITCELELQGCPRLQLVQPGTDMELALRPSPLPLRMPRPFFVSGDATFYIRLTLARAVAPAEIPLQVNMLVSGYQFIRGLWTNWSTDRYNEYLSSRLGARYVALAED